MLPEVYPTLIGLGKALSLQSLQPDESTNVVLRFTMVLDHKRKNNTVKTRTVNPDLQVNGSFLPINQALRYQLDDIVRKRLSLKLEFVNPDSNLVQDAILAGGYLCLMFPHINIGDSSPAEGTTRPDTAANPPIGSAELHLLHFNLIRFGELFSRIVLAFRGISNANRDQSVNAIAAAGILFCEIKHISGNMKLLYVSSSCSSVTTKQF